MNQAGQQDQGDIKFADVGEATIFAAWQEAIKKSFDTTDGAAETILTASFSIATAYGALIGLVAPEKEPGPIYLGVPFALFGAAALVALAARTKAVKATGETGVDKIREAIEGTAKWKRRLAWAAILLLVAALVTAGCVVAYAYGGASSDKTTALVKVGEQGLASLRSSCPEIDKGLTGELETDGDFVVLDVQAGQCGQAARTVKLAKGQVVAILEEPAAN